MNERIYVSCLDAGHSVLRLVGDFDLADLDELQDAMDTAIKLSPQAIADLKDLTFADSALLNALLEAKARSEALGGSLSLAGPSPITRKLLRLALAEQDLPMAESVAEAAGLTSSRLGTSTR